MTVSEIVVLLRVPVGKESICLRHRSLYYLSLHVYKEILTLTDDSNVHLIFGRHFVESLLIGPIAKWSNMGPQDPRLE